MKVGDYVRAQCQGRTIYGTVVRVSETWAWVEHEPAKQRPSKPRTHTVRNRVWNVAIVRLKEAS